MTDRKTCPFCGSDQTEKVSDFGTSLMVSSRFCTACKSYFESIKWGEDPADLDVPEFLRRRP